MDSVVDIQAKAKELKQKVRDLNTEIAAFAKSVPNMQITGSMAVMTRGFNVSYPIFNLKDFKIASLL